MRELNKKIEYLFDTILEYSDVPEFEKKHLLMTTWIFSYTALRFMWELQKNENIEQVDRENMVEAFGKEINAIVNKYTNIDMTEVRIYPENEKL